MKRILLLLALVLGLSACGSTTQGNGTISVEASAFCAFYNGTALECPARVVYSSFNRAGMSESDAVRVFNNLTTSSQRASISTATLHLRYIDNTSGTLLGEEDWGLLWDSTRRRFVAAPIAY